MIMIPSLKNALLLSLAALTTSAFAGADYVNDYETFTEFDSPETTEVITPRTLEEVHADLYGDRLTNPSAESLLGQYLKKTGANMSLANFLTAPEKSVNPVSKLGPNRLVVAVSEKTIASFKKLFHNPNMLFVLISPEGGVFGYAYRGKQGNYAELSAEVSYDYPGVLMVPILLSDTEASRATKFFNLGRDQTINGFAIQPWTLLNKENKPYCAVSPFSYEAWFENIPLGDTRVDSYVLPSAELDNLDGKKPVKQLLVNYKIPDGLHRAQEKLLTSVWKVPGHKQLGEILNVMAHRRGELAHSHWLPYSLLGSQGTDRVPVVFQFVENAKKKIDATYPKK